MLLLAEGQSVAKTRLETNGSMEFCMMRPRVVAGTFGVSKVRQRLIDYNPISQLLQGPRAQQAVLCFKMPFNGFSITII